MKIERAESKFEPVVITLESQAELDCLVICLNQNNKGFMENSRSVGNYVQTKEDILAASELYGPIYNRLTNLY